MSTDVPNSVRIRTNDSNAWRYDAIMEAKKLYGCNRSDAVAFAAHDVPGLVRACERVLSRDDLTPEQKREIAETLSGNVRGLTFELEHSVRISTE